MATRPFPPNSATDVFGDLLQPQTIPDPTQQQAPPENFAGFVSDPENVRKAYAVAAHPVLNFKPAQPAPFFSKDFNAYKPQQPQILPPVAHDQPFSDLGQQDPLSNILFGGGQSQPQQALQQPPQIDQGKLRQLWQQPGTSGILSRLPAAQLPSVQSQTQADQSKLDAMKKPGWAQISNPAARALARIGDVAASMLIPRAAQWIPGTTAHNQLLQAQQGEIVAQDKQADQDAQNAQTRRLQDQNLQQNIALNAPITLTQEQAQAIGAPQLVGQQVSAKDYQGMAADYQHSQNKADRVQVVQTPNGFMRLDTVSGEVTPVTYNGQAVTPYQKPEKVDPEDAFIAEYRQKNPKASIAEAQRAYKLNSQLPPQAPGITVIVPNGQGGGTVRKLTPGQTVQPGSVTAGGFNTETLNGDKAQQSQQAGSDALQYGKDYLSAGNFTGPGDEALLEKYFELAKPSSGFRMTQPQLEMLQNSRGWTNSLQGRIHHAATGTWFSDSQRKQIVSTMNALQAAKSAPSGSRGRGALNSTPRTQTQNQGVTLRAPNGQTKQVQADQVEHYIRLGARVVK